MQHLDWTPELVRAVMTERLEEARAQQRAAILVRARRQARRAESRWPARLRLVRAVLRTREVG